MNTSKRLIVPTAIAGGVAILGWIFIGMDRRAQDYAMEPSYEEEAEGPAEAGWKSALKSGGESDGEPVERSGAWIPKVANGSEEKALDEAAVLLVKKGRRQDALEMLEALAARGYHEAMLEIGRAYMDEKYSTFSPERAYAWLTVSQAFGDERAADPRSEIALEMDESDLEEAHRSAQQILAKLKKRIERHG